MLDLPVIVIVFCIFVSLAIDQVTIVTKVVLRKHYFIRKQIKEIKIKAEGSKQQEIYYKL